jgi:hypothetical protein
MRWVGYVERMAEICNKYKTSGGKPERKRQLRRHRFKLEDNIKLDLKGIVCVRFVWLRIGSMAGFC